MKEYDNKVIGNQIQKYRLSRNFSVKRLSDITGISQSYIRELENGGANENSSISMEKICNLAEALNVTLDDIAYTNIEHADNSNKDIIDDIEIELRSMSEADKELFDKIVDIFVNVNR